MAEELKISDSTDKKEMYETLLPQIKALIEGETDLTANLANIAASLRQTFGWFWVGFYWVKNGELVLAPFQGNIACTRIGYGKGVCGTAWKEKKSLFVPDVNAFSGHIACSSESVSEIVIPVFNERKEAVGVMDIDSDKFDVLDETDVCYLEQVSKIISEML